MAAAHSQPSFSTSLLEKFSSSDKAIYSLFLLSFSILYVNAFGLFFIHVLKCCGNGLTAVRTHPYDATPRSTLRSTRPRRHHMCTWKHAPAPYGWHWKRGETEIVLLKERTGKTRETERCKIFRRLVVVSDGCLSSCLVVSVFLCLVWEIDR